MSLPRIDLIIDIQAAPTESKGKGQTTVDELQEINLGTDEEPRPTFVSASLTTEKVEELKALLCEYKDCFAWNYNEMPGLSPDIAVHKLSIKPDETPIKQAPRRMRLEVEEQIIAETKKLIEAGFDQWFV